jgi:hypothetical protein
MMIEPHTHLGLSTQSSASLFPKHSACKKRNCDNDTQLKLHVRKSKTELLPIGKCYDVPFVVAMIARMYL